MRTIETENVQFRRFVFASRRYAREKERALSSVIRERETSARVPSRSGFKSPEGFLPSPRLDPSPIARVPPRARPPARSLERARVRDINSRARAPSSIPRARPHDPARRRVIRHHDARSVDRDRRCREIKSIHGCRREIEIEIATRDAHLSTSMLNVFSAIGAMIFGMNR